MQKELRAVALGSSESAQTPNPCDAQAGLCAANLASATRPAAPPFNVAFYATIATIIPVLYLALAISDPRGYKIAIRNALKVIRPDEESPWPIDTARAGSPPNATTQPCTPAVGQLHDSGPDGAVTAAGKAAELRRQPEVAQQAQAKAAGCLLGH